MFLDSSTKDVSSSSLPGTISSFYNYSFSIFFSAQRIKNVEQLSRALLSTIQSLSLSLFLSVFCDRFPNPLNSVFFLIDWSFLSFISWLDWREATKFIILKFSIFSKYGCYRQTLLFSPINTSELYASQSMHSHMDISSHPMLFLSLYLS